MAWVGRSTNACYGVGESWWMQCEAGEAALLLAAQAAAAACRGTWSGAALGLALAVRSTKMGIVHIHSSQPPPWLPIPLQAPRAKRRAGMTRVVVATVSRAAAAAAAAAVAVAGQVGGGLGSGGRVGTHGTGGCRQRRQRALGQAAAGAPMATALLMILEPSLDACLRLAAPGDWTCVCGNNNFSWRQVRWARCACCGTPAWLCCTATACSAAARSTWAAHERLGNTPLDGPETKHVGPDPLNHPTPAASPPCYFPAPAAPSRQACNRCGKPKEGGGGGGDAGGGFGGGGGRGGGGGGGGGRPGG